MLFKYSFPPPLLASMFLLTLGSFPLLCQLLLHRTHGSGIRRRSKVSIVGQTPLVTKTRGRGCDQSRSSDPPP
ncbi:hypothetical protein F5B18DRAFT_618961 [Nemania serpens]|nr:hypothetical protein F5B18DRAFT_618961 [Nemania serpens]